jgi:hypothetical protein
MVMPCKLLMLVYRHPDMTPTEFHDYYENFHMPLVQSVTEGRFNFSHKRHYIQRIAANPAKTKEALGYPALVRDGSQQEFGYDCVTQFTFEDEGAMREFFTYLQYGEAAERIQHDNRQFMDVTKTASVLLAGVEETHVRSI